MVTRRQCVPMESQDTRTDYSLFPFTNSLASKHLWTDLWIKQMQHKIWDTQILTSEACGDKGRVCCVFMSPKIGKAQLRWVVRCWDADSLHLKHAASWPEVGWGGCFGSLLNRQRRGRQRQSAFLKMPFHWSKHPSNIVPPMTGEQPGGVWRNDVRKAVLGGGEVWGSAVAQGFKWRYKYTLITADYTSTFTSLIRCSTA